MLSRKAWCRRPVRAEASSQEDKAASEQTEDPDMETSKLMAQLFGSNLQVVVWVSTLSFAAYTGIKSGDPAESGLLIAPPSAAAFLIASFLVFYFVTTNQKKERMAEFQKQREREEAKLNK
eukprot:CAMPEP_0114231654 /NCGR_PEP_ID=MMETSP0058-20121206/4172_1 /TAXON_ID=36894 /ORGANISM="Pyramimonas parkeae, CCMP726" /LENGTH=120 /DNA_ID=CAMNT_0001343043 /DNA_START=178 /DNA_END=540 /DNA_ORIENTATION=-